MRNETFINIIRRSQISQLGQNDGLITTTKTGPLCSKYWKNCPPQSPVRFIQHDSISKHIHMQHTRTLARTHARTHTHTHTHALTWMFLRVHFPNPPTLMRRRVIIHLRSACLWTFCNYSSYLDIFWYMRNTR